MKSMNIKPSVVSIEHVWHCYLNVAFMILIDLVHFPIPLLLTITIDLLNIKLPKHTLIH